MSQNIAIIGLGSMGFGMALSAVRGAHRVWGDDLSAKRKAEFVVEGGETSLLSEAAPQLDVVAVVVLNAAQTEDVLFGDNGIAPKLRKGAVVMGCATVPPEFAKDMEARCTALGILYLDAPISGGAGKAAQGRLSIMASGHPDAFAAAKPALESLSETVFKLGDHAGPGSAMKAVNQLLAGVHIAAMAEAMTFGMTQGVAPEQFLDVISKCAGTSWMLENRAPHIVEGDYSPRSQVAIWPKDLGIVLDIAKSTGFNAPITQTALDQFKAAADMGLAAEDDAAVAKTYARQAGITLPGE